MARTVEEIKGAILSAKAGRSELNVLSSPSGTSIWRGWAHVTAVAHNVVETFFDLFKAEVNDIIARKEYGTPQWFAERAQEFQLGDVLTVTNGKVGYATVDPSKRLVSRVAFKEGSGLLTLKLAKGAPEAEAFSANELQQFVGYIEKIKPAGLNVSTISLNADKLRVTGTVYFDGINAPAAIKTAVEAALAAYMKELPFDGMVYRNRVIDAIQQVLGVVDVDLSGLDLVQGATVVPVGRVSETASGYLTEDDQQDFATTLIYTAVNV